MTEDFYRRMIIFAKGVLRGDIRYKSGESMLLIHKMKDRLKKISRLTLNREDKRRIKRLLLKPIDGEILTPRDILAITKQDVMDCVYKHNEV